MCVSAGWGWKNTARCGLTLLSEVNGEHQSWSVLGDITALSSAFAVQAVHYGGALFLFYVTVARVIKVICMWGVCVCVSRKAPDKVFNSKITFQNA